MAAFKARAALVKVFPDWREHSIKVRLWSARSNAACQGSGGLPASVMSKAGSDRHRFIASVKLWLGGACLRSVSLLTRRWSVASMALFLFPGLFQFRYSRLKVPQFHAAQGTVKDQLRRPNSDRWFVGLQTFFESFHGLQTKFLKCRNGSLDDLPSGGAEGCLKVREAKPALQGRLTDASDFRRFGL
jgi:hypothetical protein